MATKNPVEAACEAFDNCPNRQVEQTDVFTINLDCPRYPDGATFLDTKEEGQRVKYVFMQDKQRGQAARFIGCLGCKFKEKTPDEITAEQKLEGLHPAIQESSGSLFATGHFTEASTAGYLVVRDRLRELTGHERASEAFGKGGLRIEARVADNVDDDFQQGVRFLAMSGDMFRNVGSHTADKTITGSEQALAHLGISSLVMHYLDSASVDGIQQG